MSGITPVTCRKMVKQRGERGGDGDRGWRGRGDRGRGCRGQLARGLIDKVVEEEKSQQFLPSLPPSPPSLPPISAGKMEQYPSNSPKGSSVTSKGSPYILPLAPPRLHPEGHGTSVEIGGGQAPGDGENHGAEFEEEKGVLHARPWQKVNRLYPHPRVYEPGDP